MHPLPHLSVTLSCTRRLACAAALLLATAAGAQTQPTGPAQPAMQPSMPMPAAATERNAASGDNTPAPVARQQRAEIAKGDPARWHREDATTAERMRSMRKEAAAALQENLGACRSQPTAERSACMREARTLYQQEMKGGR